MIRVVVDTNVLVGGLLSPNGPPGRIVARWRRRELVFCLSAAMFRELEEVLARPYVRHSGRVSEESVGEFLAALRDASEFVEPAKLDGPVCRDPDDDMLFAAALSARAEVIVSGDADVLAVGSWRDVRIATPRQLIDELEAGEPA